LETANVLQKQSYRLIQHKLLTIGQHSQLNATGLGVLLGRCQRMKLLAYGHCTGKNISDA
jgi:hypothetical protein